MEEMLQELKAAYGYMSISAVIQQAVIEMHSKKFPSYSNTSKLRVGDKTNIEEEKKERDKKKLVAICGALGGKIVESPGGGKQVCEYYTYDGRNRYSQTSPLDMLNEDMLVSQYQPSREKVEKLQKEGKVNY